MSACFRFVRTPARAFGPVVRWLGRLQEPQIRLRHCVSIRGLETITLPGGFLPQASVLDIHWNLRRPLLRPGWKRAISIQFKPALPADVFVLEQRRRWGRIDCRLRLKLLAREPRPVRFEIFEQPGERCFGELEVQPVPLAEAQRLRLEALRAQDLRLWVCTGNQRHCSGCVPANSDFLLPEFTLPVSPFNAWLPPCETMLSMILVSGTCRQLLLERPLTLSRRQLTVSGPPLLLQALEPNRLSGPCSLSIALGEREIASFPFRIVSEKQVLQAVRVKQIRLAAQRRNGQTARGVKVLRWEEHQAILPWLQLDVPILAPATRVRCVAAILHGRKMLRSEEFLLPLDRASQLVLLQPLDLVALGLPARDKPTRLLLTVQLNGEQKTALELVVLPPERLTNFEGQLNIDARQLPLDDCEYEQIIHELGVRDPDAGGRFSWRKLLRPRRRITPKSV
jgi:hypothetical protein